MKQQRAAQLKEVGKLGKLYCLKPQDLECFISNEHDDYFLQSLRDGYYSDEDDLYFRKQLLICICAIYAVPYFQE